MILSNLNKIYRHTNDIVYAPKPLSGGSEPALNLWAYNSVNHNGLALVQRASAYTTNRYLYQVGGDYSDYSALYVAVGYGNTAENIDDYKLADMQGIDSNLLTHKYGYNKNFQGDSEYPIWVESVYENTGDTNVIVKEIGLVFRPTFYTFSGASWTNMNYLLARKVLANPVTIHPNEIYKFIYRLKF